MVLKKCLSDSVQFQMEIRKTSRRLLRSVDDAELGHITFAEFGKEMYNVFGCTFQLKYVFRLEENTSCIVGQTSLAGVKRANDFIAVFSTFE